MWVQMTSAVAGRPAYALGEVAELDDRIAQAWIAGGLAIPVRQPVADTAEQRHDDTERAVTHRGRRR